MTVVYQLPWCEKSCQLLRLPVPVNSGWDLKEEMILPSTQDGKDLVLLLYRS